MKKIYLIGSLRNPHVPELAKRIRTYGHEVFDDWFAGGPTADDHWRDYHKNRGQTFSEAMECPMAQHIFDFDKYWLDWADTAILLSPAGKSGHLEAGYMVGRGKDVVALVDDPDRWDVMYKFLNKVFSRENDLIEYINSISSIREEIWR